MAYLILHLAPFLLIALLFAFAGGWAWHALTTADAEEALEQERARLLKDVNTFLSDDAVSGPSTGISPELDREMDMLRRRADLSAARVTELENAMEAARLRAEEAIGRAAEAERALEAVGAEAEEIAALRARIATLEAERARAPAPMNAASEEEAAAQAWRLRYFEQRVRYLESQARSVEEAPQQTAPQAASEVSSADLMQLDWRARYAEACANAMYEILHEPAPEISTLAEIAPAEAPELALMRDRLRYLETRLEHLQAQAEAPAPESPPEADDVSAERLKWRARYLEARLRGLEAALEAARAAPAAADTPASEAAELVAASVDADKYEYEDEDEAEEEAPAPLVPAGSEERPHILSGARDGAPDDFTLIEGVTPQQQMTLNSLGIYHFEQIAAWTPANIAWVDQYLRLRGRISQEEWVEQARAIVRGGAAAARRVREEAL